MPVTISKLKTKQQFLKALIYAPPGIGKTWLAGTSPNPLFIDVEGGTMTIRDLDIPVATAVSWEDIEEILDNLEAKAKGWEKFNTLVIDSITEVQVLLHEKLLEEGAANSKRDRDTDVMEIQDWGKSLVRMQRLLKRFRDLPMHVIMTALSEEGLDQSKKLVVYPMLQGKMARLLPALMDLVGYLYIEEGDDNEQHRLLLVQPLGKYTAKDRTGSLGNVVQDPTIPKLIAGVTKNKEA